MAIPVADLEARVRERLSIGSLSRFDSLFLDELIRQIAQGKPLSNEQATKLAHILHVAPSRPVITKYPKEGG